MLKSLMLAALITGVIPAAAAQTAFTVNGQLVSVEEQKQLMGFLKANGVTNEKQLKNAARSILIEQKIIEQAARSDGLLEDPRVRVLTSEKQSQLYGSILSRRYASEHPITEEQIRNRYDELLSSYDPHEIKFRHISVKTQEEAKEIIQSLKAGADFGALAKEKSLDQSTSQNGGQIPFTNIRNVLVPGLAEAILALQPGELLPVPFKSKLGYHVVLLEEKREVPFPPYEEVKPKLLAELERLQTTEFLNNLQKDAKIILEPPE
ncbi:peptidyl-prolyl cis-trans isomerase [uncultured Parasutterella sp.]|uniref:peptidylprolyl isomerase n=1 Tax=uncultured Parasutterella sp. TaxID=1263098 RepID=UPI0025D1D9AA|nr:peptidyl-prolyl cis-trans isomerase [uncultured Parasutterella sp.]